MFSSKLITTILLPVAMIGATTGFVAGCGDGGIDKAKIKEVQKQGQDLQKQGAKVQADAAQITADIKSGKITAAEGQKKLEAETAAVEKSAKKTASNAIDAVKDNKYLSDDQKKQIQDAQAQLNK